MKFLHLASAIIWLGGMSFMLLAMRPALMKQLAAPTRAPLLAEIWQRFFALVAVCVLVLLATGLYFFASIPKGGHAGIPFGWHIMFALGVLMMLIFGHIYFAAFRGYKKALAAGDKERAAAKAGQIHKLVVANFILGWLSVAAVRLL
jgi:uncharacterized membrane protein